MNTDTYTIARCFAAGGTLAAILAWPMSERYGLTAGVSWVLVALLGLFGAWYDQRVVRRSQARRRAYKRSQGWVYGTLVELHPPTPGATVSYISPERLTVTRRWTPDSVVADLLIQEDHRRIRKGEQA